MAYIGKVKISNSWEKLEDLIKAQISGQSSFSFSTSKSYSLQADGANNVQVRVCDTSVAPASETAGEHLDGAQFAVYEPTSGNALYVKQNGFPAFLSVSELA